VREDSAGEAPKERVECSIFEWPSVASRENVLITLAALEADLRKVACLESRAQSHCLAFVEKRKPGLRFDAKEKVRNPCQCTTLASGVTPIDDM
jgi:hypothetical protein